MLRSVPIVTSPATGSGLAFPAPLQAAHFLARPNRFVILAEHEGRTISVRCPSPGSLRELLTPGAELLVHVPPDSRTRRTDATLVLIRHQRRWVSVDTQLPNRLMAEHLINGVFAPFQDAVTIEREVGFGRSRLDFRLTQPDGRRQLLEVKCCNLVIRQRAFFPDAVSDRATRHVRELIEAIKNGYEPWIVFLVTRADAISVSPFGEADPRFAAAMTDAVAAGVGVLAATHRVTRSGITLLGEVPFLPNPTG